MWKTIDAIACWLRETLGYKAQLRLGILTVILSIPLYIYAPFTSEPVMVYLMSAVAITFTGIGIVVAAEAAKEASDNGSS